jgi:hypothetical protein
VITRPVRTRDGTPVEVDGGRRGDAHFVRDLAPGALVDVTQVEDAQRASAGFRPGVRVQVAAGLDLPAAGYARFWPRAPTATSSPMVAGSLDLPSRPSFSSSTLAALALSSGASRPRSEGAESVASNSAGPWRAGHG